MAVTKTQPTLFGWCMQGSEDHKNCRVQYTDWNDKQRVCSCSCHQTKPSRKSKAARAA
jgi:hypothetical protein